VKVEPCPKRARAFADDELVADTINALFVWEVPYYPSYYVPAADVPDLVSSGTIDHSPSRADAELLDVRTAREVIPSAALRYPAPNVEALLGYVRFEWAAMNERFEEDEPVYAHPRDPRTRVDILDSSRRVERLDMTVDDVAQERPRSRFSRLQ
jgi:uncharacterized protein (DUF427 family)